ncbi:MAG: hypothetical protein GYA35_10065 [Thermoanaerobaculaceae bacterium]|nr:hypothetical protein [Thermoanaerobaculaceae bacterium]
MIKGALSVKSEKEWNSFMDKLQAKKKKRIVQKRLKFLITALAFVIAVIFALNIKSPKPNYLFARIPLKNSQAIIVEEGSVVEISENAFVLNTGVSK